MRFRNHSRQTLLGIAAVTVVLGCTFPDCVRDMGLDFWNTHRYHAELLEEQARTARLEISGCDAKTRLHLKLEITENILADQTTLAQATEQFLRMNRTGEDITEMVRYNFPAATLEESTELHVMNFVRIRVQHLPADRQEAVLARLNRERRMRLTALSGYENNSSRN